MLEAREVNLVYRTGGVETYALRRVNLFIRPGEIVGVKGPSGHGKSSLLYLLSGLRRPTSGSVVFEGQDYHRLTPNELADLRRANFSFIFQYPFLIGYLTVLENIGVAAPALCSGRLSPWVEALCDRLGLTPLLDRTPNQLSGGQRQRAAIARALAGRPRVIFADEPTASLDSASAREVVDVLGDYRREGGTLLLVTHDDGIFRCADRLVEMRGGRVITAGRI